MKKNVGSIDKIVRLLIAILALYAAYTDMVASPWNYVLYAVAVVLFLTALTNFCPLFSIFGISSSKNKKS